MDISVDSNFSEPEVDEGYIFFKNEQILACFNPVLDRGIEVANSQITEIKRRGGSLKVTTTFPAASLHF